MPKKVKDTYHKIGELLVRRNLASSEAIDQALALQRADLERNKTPRRLGEILVERKVLSKSLIREILEEQRIGRGETRKLRVDLRDRDGVAIVSLEGRLDGTKTDAAIRVFERLMNRGFARIAVDGRKLTTLDSYGVSSLVAYIDEARARGGDMKFFGLNHDVRLVMERLGLSKFVQTFEDEEETIKAFDLSIDEYMSWGALAEYISVPGSRTFHLSYCAAAQKINEEDRLYFESKWHAREAGRQPCQKCKP